MSNCWKYQSQNKFGKYIQSAVLSGKHCAVLPHAPLSILRCRSVLHKDGFVIQRGQANQITHFKPETRRGGFRWLRTKIVVAKQEV